MNEEKREDPFFEHPELDLGMVLEDCTYLSIEDKVKTIEKWWEFSRPRFKEALEKAMDYKNLKEYATEMCNLGRQQEAELFDLKEEHKDLEGRVKEALSLWATIIVNIEEGDGYYVQLTEGAKLRLKSDLQKLRRILEGKKEEK